MNSHIQPVLFSNKMYQLPESKAEQGEAQLNFPIVPNVEAMPDFLKTNQNPDGTFKKDNQGNDELTEGDKFRAGVDGLFDKLIQFINQQWNKEEDKALQLELVTIAAAFKTRFHTSGNDEDNNQHSFELYTKGVRALHSVCNALNDATIADDTKKNAIRNLIQGSRVCLDGIYLNIVDCDKELKQDLSSVYMQARENLAKEAILELFRENDHFKELRKYENARAVLEGREIHYARSILNLYAPLLGIQYEADQYAEDLSQPYDGEHPEHPYYQMFKDIHEALQSIAHDQFLPSIGKIINAETVINYLLSNKIDVEKIFANISSENFENFIAKADIYYYKPLDKYGKDDQDLFSIQSLLNSDNELRKPVEYNTSLKVSLLERLRAEGYLERLDIDKTVISKQLELYSINDDLRNAYFITTEFGGKVRIPFYLYFIENVSDLSAEESLKALNSLPPDITAQLIDNIKNKPQDELINYFLNQPATYVWQLMCLADKDVTLENFKLGKLTPDQEQIAMELVDKNPQLKGFISASLMTDRNLSATMPASLAHTFLKNVSWDVIKKESIAFKNNISEFNIIEYLSQIEKFIKLGCFKLNVASAEINKLPEFKNQINELLENIPAHDFEKFLTLQGHGASGFIRTIDQIKDPALWELLIDKMSPEIFLDILTSKTNSGMTSLESLIYRIDDPVLLKIFIDKLSPKILADILNFQDRVNHQTVFDRLVGQLKNPALWDVVIARMSSESLSDILTSENIYGDAKFPRFQALIFQTDNPALLKIFIDKITSQSLAELLESRFGNFARYIQDPAIFKVLIDKMTPDSLADILKLTNRYGERGFDTLVFEIKVPAVLKVFVDKITPQVLGDILKLKDGVGFPKFHDLLFKTQDPAIWKICIDKITPDSLADILKMQDRFGYSGLSQLVRHIKDIELLKVFLDKMTPESLAYTLDFLNKGRYSDQSLSAAVFLFITDPKSMKSLIDNVNINPWLNEFKLLKANSPVLLNFNIQLKQMKKFIKHPKDSIKEHPKLFLEFLKKGISEDITQIVHPDKWADLLKRALSCDIDKSTKDELNSLLTRVQLAAYRLEAQDDLIVKKVVKIQKSIVAIHDISKCGAADSYMMAEFLLNQKDRNEFLILQHLKNADDKGHPKAKVILIDLLNGKDYNEKCVEYIIQALQKYIKTPVTGLFRKDHPLVLKKLISDLANGDDYGARKAMIIEYVKQPENIKPAEVKSMLSDLDQFLEKIISAKGISHNEIMLEEKQQGPR
ncbi:MAG: hypothetical protein P4M12_00770 [Gammaproteobacteria bacterium]|nr:hypothetical protein [Gammaproteobacteria bacterium]